MFLLYLWRTLITNGVAHNVHYNMVQNEITMDDLLAELSASWQITKSC